MDYLDVLERGMDMGKQMTHEEVEQFLLEKNKANGKMDWDKLAAELKRAGHVSPKTGKPLSASGLRQIWFYRMKPQKDGVTGTAVKIQADTRALQKLEMVESILKTEAKDSAKLDLIKLTLSMP